MPSRMQNETLTRWAAATLIALSVVLLDATDDTTLRVSVKGRVSRLAIEDYVARVVTGEGQPTAAAGAQQALAVAARTYALANRQRHRREGFDLCDTTHCQVLRPATATAREAARATAGRVLTHQGQLASIFYSALCGGHSELASQVWPGADDTSSHLQEDDACRNEPGWSSEFRAGDIERALRAAGHRGTRLRELRILERNDSGRVVRLRVDGFTPGEISGTDFRAAMSRQAGIRSFRSTAFEVRRSGASYTFTGTGFGHGVGLCVIGAGHRAARGASADAILKFYFPKLTIGSTVAGKVLRSPSAPGGRVVVPPARTAPARPPVHGAEAEILDMVRRAHDEIAKATGTRVTTEFRVTVHPSVDAFARATGQPWWVSSASDGTQIDLVPISLLKQRGQYEIAARREVARALTDTRLRGRALWVREGAAAYFADPTAPVTASGACPKDDELSRPVSAGTHRNALARAEACYRKEIAKGKRWDQVR